jgi:DNA-binding MarR family transcriptional regulator
VFADEDLFVYLHSIMKKMKKAADLSLAPLGFTHAEMRVLLLMMIHFPYGCRQEELPPRLFIDPSNVGRSLKKLEALKYIKREKSKDDGRAYQVVLTDRARAIRDRLVEIKTRIRNAFAKSMTERDLKTMMRLLKKADQGLDQMGQPGL